MVTITDRIWPRSGIELDQAWEDLLAAEHGTDVVPLDSAIHGEASRRIINDRVSDRTDELIAELEPNGFIKPQTVLVTQRGVQQPGAETTGRSEQLRARRSDASSEM
jgi:serine protease inhibitor